MKLQEKFQDMKDDLRSLSKDDILARLGLQTRESDTVRLLNTLGTFGVGLLVGAGVALLLAPKPGRELREDIRTKVRRGRDGLAEAAAE